jgi:hypothetical protein
MLKSVGKIELVKMGKIGGRLREDLLSFMIISLSGLPEIKKVSD